MSAQLNKRDARKIKSSHRFATSDALINSSPRLERAKNSFVENTPRLASVDKRSPLHSFPNFASLAVAPRHCT